jgi:hypothetical protein
VLLVVARLAVRVLAVLLPVARLPAQRAAVLRAQAAARESTSSPAPRA